MAEPDCAMVERDQGKGAESPEDKGVGEAGEGALADDFCLAHDFPDEVPDASADGGEVEAGVFFRVRGFCWRIGPKRRQKSAAGGGGHGGEEEHLSEGEVLGFGAGLGGTRA